MPTTTVALPCIAHGTANLAFAQLVANAATTRVGTTATLTMLATATLATGDNCLIQGHDLDEYNGVFAITVASGTTITYVIEQDPGANSAVTVATVDRVTLSAAMDVSTGYGGAVLVAVQNSAIGPTAPAQVWVGQSNVDVPANYFWRQIFSGDTVARSVASAKIPMPMGDRFYKVAVCRNTGQPVDIATIASHTTAG